MPSDWLDPHRLAALQALGVPITFVRRSLLGEAEVGALLPVLPGMPAARSAAHALNSDKPGATSNATSVAGAQTRGGSPAQGQAQGAADALRPVGVRPTTVAKDEAVFAATRPAALHVRLAQATPARLQQISSLDLSALAAFAHDCRACRLGGLRHQAVFGVGHAQAQVMVVGEAPGAEEDRQGEPFVGAAGKLLDNMLRAVGLARVGDNPARTVYIANVIKCRPPGNRNPEADEIAQCEPILQRQIKLVRPRLLLALGRFAAQQLTGSTEPIGRLRQRAFQYQGIPVVVSYHPAYLLRTPLDKAKAWADLCFAQDQLAAALQSADAPAS
jgi:DNA polymerase